MARFALRRLRSDGVLVNACDNFVSRALVFFWARQLFGSPTGDAKVASQSQSGVALRSGVALLRTLVSLSWPRYASRASTRTRRPLALHASTTSTNYLHNAGVARLDRLVSNCSCASCARSIDWSSTRRAPARSTPRALRARSAATARVLLACLQRVHQLRRRHGASFKRGVPTPCCVRQVCSMIDGARLITPAIRRCGHAPLHRSRELIFDAHTHTHTRSLLLRLRPPHRRPDHLQLRRVPSTYARRPFLA